MTTTGTTTTTGTGRAVYPSDTLPGIPPFTFPVPEGWVVEPSLDALAVARIPVADDGFWASIIVTANRVPSGLKLRQAVETTYLQFLRRYPDAKLQGERLAAYDDRETYVRVVEVTGDDGRAVSQLHAVLLRAAPGRQPRARAVPVRRVGADRAPGQPMARRSSTPSPDSGSRERSAEQRAADPVEHLVAQRMAFGEVGMGEVVGCVVGHPDRRHTAP